MDIQRRAASSLMVSGFLVLAASCPARPAEAAATSVTGAGVTLTSVSVDLPAGDRAFPAGPNSDVAEQNCTVCHSVGMVLNQPALSRESWAKEVSKMRMTFKAPVTDADAAKIVDYLTAIKGKT
jgi:cytochrome c5